MTIRNLEHLLEPASVAVFGASDSAGSVGATVWRNLRAGGFAGPVYAVDSKLETLDDEQVYAGVADLPAAPALALICTPADSVAGLIAELGAVGTRAAVLMTAGMTAEQKQAALDAARPHLLRLLGPHCIGLMTPHLGLNASVAHTDALPGELAFVSQSGALVTAMLDWAKSRHIGFSQMVSLGESSDVDFGDLLDHLASDGRTRAILLHVESIKAPRKFMSAARAAARNKPVIIVKAGRAGQGVRAATSHSGALAGADIVFDAAIRRAGMLRVDTLQDLFLAAETLARFRANRSTTLTVVANGGGGGVMAADAAAMAGVPLYELGEPVLERLAAVLPANWSRGNPIDIGGDAPAERYAAALSALLADPDAGAVLFIHAPTASVPSADIAGACAPLLSTTPGRVMGCWLGDAAVAEARRIFEQAGAPDYATPEEAVRAFAMLATYRRNQEALLEAPSESGNSTPDLGAARALVEQVLTEGRELLSETESGVLLQAYGVPVVQTRTVALTPDAAVHAARALGYPVALKILSPDITHKTEVGGVQLNLEDDADVQRAATTMIERVRERQPRARLEGFTLQAMVRRPQGQELIVGASIDPLFGPVLLFGQGGTAVEVVSDRAVALPPLNRALAAELVSRTRVARLLAGYSDHAPARLAALYDVLIAVSQMLADLPQLAELDINPLLLDDQGAIALDARVRVSAEASAGAAHFAIRPYPAQLVETLEWQGRSIVLRPIRPEDEDRHRVFLESLDPEDVRMRVFGSRRELPRNELARLTQIDYAREMAFVAVDEAADGGPQTLGVVRASTDPDNLTAEFGVIVRSELKGQGLGRALLAKMIRYARGRGTQALVAYVLRENRGMRELARSLGFVTDPAQPHDGDTVHMSLQLGPEEVEADAGAESGPQQLD
jgi:acetyltransferase